jgi:molybdenum cofactor synthesis domain-containing protein
MSADPTAAILLIGEELLSGKVDDENARYAIRELRALGVAPRRVEIIPDVVDEIAAAVRAASARYDHVFTSGGVGATHDDVTLAAVAAAFDMPVERRPELAQMIRDRLGPEFHERDLRMADVPAGATLDYGVTVSSTVWPVVVVRNVYVLPGVPAIFRRKFDLIKERFRATPIHTRALYSREGEARIAAALDAAVAAFPSVAIGSYPHLDALDYRVKVTFDGRDEAAVRSAVAFLVERLGPEVVLRTE